ncbi:hypothetical protein ACFRAU_07535 [Arthrobacter sp. NPDC056691]|uniref:hypothetical protein n=1 Tax=Arthrobacter sp. NPDC056691 TaxID=3345913 RepID=UPI00366CD818
MCLQHMVSRMAARRALTVLENEALVYREGTRGTFVAEANRNPPANRRVDGNNSPREAL